MYVCVSPSFRAPQHITTHNCFVFYFICHNFLVDWDFLRMLSLLSVTEGLISLGNYRILFDEINQCFLRHKKGRLSP